jgi:predicted PurR-regulated permease PerM
MWAFFLLTFAAILLCGFVLQPFLAGIVFAITIAVCTQKPYRWLNAHIRNPSLCATAALVILILVGVVPLVAIGQQLFVQASSLITALRNGAATVWIQHFVAHHPALAAKLQSAINLVDLGSITQSAAAWSGKYFLSFIGSSASLVFQIVIMLFLLFFLWRDNQAAIKLLRSILPVNDEAATQLIDRLHDTIYATGFGRLAIAAIQGILGGLAYWALGVPAPGFWGFLTGLFAIIPGFGAVLVWAPIAVYLGFGDSWGKALLLTIWGGGIVSLIDNFLYPLLVGSSLRMHTAVIFISLLGGVSLFGPSGVILGPLAFALAGTLIDIWRHRSQTTPL